jgi:3-oxoacyl-[acyl-carrier protein] reductase
VKRLAADGASVVFSYLNNQAAADSVAAEVAGAGGRALAVQADQGSLADLRRLAGQAEEHLDGAFLAGPDSGWITGQNLLATGGLLP